jgi:hypothetical protein
MFKYIALTVLLLVASTALAQQNEDVPSGSLAEVALSNDTLQLRYETTGDMVGVDDSRVSGAFFLSEERDIVLSAGLGFPVDLDFGLGPLSVAVGPQVYAALLDEENNDVLSVSIGAQLRFLLNRRLGLAVAGHAYYAPDILTFGSADNLTDLGARVEIALAEQVIAFGGMRWFEFDLTSGLGEQTLQEELFVGVGYRF